MTEVWVKCEWHNPSGSVKDRAAYWMIRDAEDSGKLVQGKRLLDSTSGNTGIALAQIAASRGHKITLCVPSNVSEMRIRLLRHLGADLVLTPNLEGGDGARAEAEKIFMQEPDKYVFLDQYSNPMNWRAHYEGTAEEIWQQTSGRVTHFVCCVGTSGTFIGTSKRLRELNSKIKRIAVQPAELLHGIEGLKDFSTTTPPIFDQSLVSRVIRITTEVAFATAKKLAITEGVPCGSSGGAAVAAALEVATQLKQGLIVAILPDNIMKTIAESEWVKK